MRITRNRAFVLTAALGAALTAGTPVFAQEAASVGGGQTIYLINTLFIAICAILVMWMAAGFAMLEAGFVRSKNVATQCAKNIGLFTVAGLGYYVIGYGLMFPGTEWMIEGTLGSAGVMAIDGGRDDVAIAPGVMFLFQVMFCAATASIVSGALAERVRLWPFFLFIALLTAVLYPISASWNWGGGFLATSIGFQDFAGGTMVHSVGGWAALTGSIILGARAGRYVNGRSMPMPGSNVPLMTLGVLILWMGWFGFNAGSHLSFETAEDARNIGQVFANTNAAAIGGVIAAMVLTHFMFGQMDLTIILNGALAGLVSITAEPLMPSVGMSLLIGAVGGAIVVLSIPLLDRLRIDDVVGAIPVHLFCGIWGTLAVIFSNPAASLGGQLAGIAIVGAFIASTSMLIWFVLRLAFSLRATDEDQQDGLDISELGLLAYPEFEVAAEPQS